MRGEKVLNRRVWGIRHLRPYKRLTLLALTHRADLTGKVKTSPRKIAEMLNCNESTIRRALSELRDDELVEWVDVRGGRGRTENTYRLTL